MRFTVLLILIFSPALFSSCGEPDTDIAQRYISEELEFAHGEVDFWVELDGSEQPMSIGVVIHEALMASPPQESVRITLPWPQETGAIEPIRHAALYYLPQGHSPSGYDVAQFKFRTYFIDEQEYEGLLDADNEERITPPDSIYLPANYGLLERDSHPPVGSQWTHTGVQAGENFGINFAYGFNEGELIFQETMVSRQFMMQVEDRFRLNLPFSFQREGYYPGIIHHFINTDNNEFFIAKEGLEFKTAE